MNRKLYRQIIACAAMEGMAADKFGFMQVLIREGLAEATAGRGRLKVKYGRKEKMSVIGSQLPQPAAPANPVPEVQHHRHHPLRRR